MINIVLVIYQHNLFFYTDVGAEGQVGISLKSFQTDPDLASVQQQATCS